MSLAAALLEVVDHLDRAGLPYMVIDGFAVIQWSEPRATPGLDLTVDGRDDALIEVAGDMGEILIDNPAEFLARSRVLPVRMADGTRVDIIAATLPFESEAITRARVIDVNGTGVRFCSPEDLIIHKIVSERSRDHEDVRGILRRQRSTIDLPRLDRLVESLAREMTSNEILERYRAAKMDAGFGES